MQSLYRGSTVYAKLFPVLIKFQSSKIVVDRTAYVLNIAFSFKTTTNLWPLLGRNGEESIPMLMMNHTDKEEKDNPGMPPRTRPPVSDIAKSAPRLVEITSNPGTPLRVTEIKPDG